MYVKLNESQEKKSAYGTVAYIPYYDAGRIKMNYILSDGMIPLSLDHFGINELCVFSPETIKGMEYVYVQLFVQEKQEDKEGNLVYILAEDGMPAYFIKNMLLKKQSNKEKNFAYVEVEDFNEMPGYEIMEQRINTNSSTRPFVIDKPNIANNIDPDSPLGVAVYANAIDSMRMCDIIFDSYQNEFMLGKKRVMVAPEAMNIETGEPVFDPNDVTYYQLPKSAGLENKPFIQEMELTIRASEHKQSLQDALNTLSYQCGLGDNFFRYSAGGIATATQVVSENNAMFRTKKKHEIILESVLVDLVRLIIEIGARYNLVEGLNPNPEITVKFDDSIIEDKDQEIKRRMAEVAAGLLDPVAYMAWRYGVTRDEAIKLMPATPAGNIEEGMQ